MAKSGYLGAGGSCPGILILPGVGSNLILLTLEAWCSWPVLNADSIPYTVSKPTHNSSTLSLVSTEHWRLAELA